MSELRTLVDDHYQNKISFEEYREQRSQLLKLIDEDLNGIKIIEPENSHEANNESSLIDKALMFLTNR
ncbi:MAG: hypothetical protein QM484_13105 [Woeseiaceae bacterium]